MPILNLADISFVLQNVLDAPTQLRALPPYGQFDADLMIQALDEANRFATVQIAPSSCTGNRSGCWSDAGNAVTPPGFGQACQAFRRAGWPALHHAVEDGGRGLPMLLDAVWYEMLGAANHGWARGPASLDAIWECLNHQCGKAIEDRYLEKIASGEGLTTMCMTEAPGGNDPESARTIAVEQPDGSYHICGDETFVFGDEHDLSDNIVHLVLGRTGGASAGSEGLSLFLCPKFLDDGTRNTVHCERIEPTMGAHGSAICEMRFQDAIGWLVGIPNCGPDTLHELVLSAQLRIGSQALGLLDAAWQKAIAHVGGEHPRERVAGSDSDRSVSLAAIGRNLMSRRLLDTQRAWIDAGRVLAYQTAIERDVARHHADPMRRERARRWCGLATPVLKSAFTQQAFQGASECLQLLGDRGHLRRSGIEQIVRDAHMTLTDDGAEETPAIALLVRKLLPDEGVTLSAWLLELRKDLDAARPFDADILRRLAELRYATTKLVHAAKGDATLQYRVAEDYLRIIAITLLAWCWARIERAHGADDLRWKAPAEAFRDRVLPEFDMRMRMMREQVDRAMAVATPP